MKHGHQREPIAGVHQYKWKVKDFMCLNQSQRFREFVKRADSPSPAQQFPKVFATSP